MNPSQTLENRISGTLAWMLGAVLGLGSSLAQTTVNVGGAGVIGVSTLTTSGGVATLPANGSKWTAAGGNGNTFSFLDSPSATVSATGPVTLSFTHRYNFEETWDGGAVYVSINGGSYTKVPLASFSANGYNSVAVASVWSAGDEIFSGQSAGWGTPALLTSVADLGTLNAGDTVSFEFRGGWDANTFPASPNWEIGSVNLADSASTLLNVDFATDGKAGFTASAGGNSASPWTYLTPTFRFELDADTDTADRFAPDVQGSVIDLNNARIEVSVLNGTLQSGDTFTLFDLSGGTTLTGSVASISLPGVGVWDTSQLATNGTITLTTYTAADGTWTANASGNWSDGTKWAGGTVASSYDKTASFTANITAATTVTVDSPRTIGNIIFTDSGTSSHDLTLAGTGSNILTLDVTTGSPVINVTQSGRRLIVNSQIAGSDGFTKSGPGVLNLGNNATNYTGATTVNGGMLDFGAIPNANIGGGSGRNISVSAGAMVRFNSLSNAILNRLVETTAEITVMSGTTSNDLDFSSSTGANLPNAFFGNWASNGAKMTYTGTLTPASDAYRLGGAGSSGLLGMTKVLGGTQGLIVKGSGVRVDLVAANTFTGDTVINSGARLTLGNNLALQNSPLDVGSSGGNFSCAAGTNAGRITGETAANSPTFGGLKGSRNLLSVFSNSASNNETNLAASAVTGFTLNPGSGVSCTYAGNIANFAPGTTLTKTGNGTQTLSGTNTYSGATNVNGGTLNLVGGSQASPITVAAGASLGFTLGSPTTSSSTVNLTTGTVKITGTVDNASDYLLMTASSITGTPTLDAPIANYQLQKVNGDTQLKLVYTAGVATYASWSGGAAADADSNGDGVLNGVAWALGASGTGMNAISLLPTLDTASDPAYLIFTFNRSDAAKDDPNTSITVQYGSDLAGWTTAVHDGDNVIITETPGSPTDAVQVKLKRSTLQAGARLFARLKVAVTTTP